MNPWKLCLTQMATDDFWGFAFYTNKETKKMSDFKISLTHDHEARVVGYCVQKGLEINQANAYEITLDAFKDNSVMVRTADERTGEPIEVNMSARVARLIECQPKTVERLADKVLLETERYKQRIRTENIKKAKATNIPNLDKLVQNLHRLNIVDGEGYLALVCFLMQLRYSRDSEVPENDKTCVFFNGVARNGKSATAKAICDIESGYGEVFKASSGKVLESTHEERVWKSHLNYFDEVKPTDIDRELLLTIVNGGEVELNPKNKRHYIQHVNTNNIFTSNDRINLKQRRVSIIKFGDRLNGRPLETGTLRKIIYEVMQSLPCFSRYHEIYKAVSITNETRINPLAIESIITFMTSKLDFVRPGHHESLGASVIFAPHEIYNCIKGTYSKQLITSERKEAIVQALESFELQGLIERVQYENCTTKNFKVVGENYLKIMAQFDKINTTAETNKRITTDELHGVLLPYYIDPKDDDTDTQAPKESNPEWVDILLQDHAEKENQMFLPEDKYQHGKRLYKDADDKVLQAKDTLTEDNKMEFLQSVMTMEACQAITLQGFFDIFNRVCDKDTVAIMNQEGYAGPDIKPLNASVFEKEGVKTLYDKETITDLYVNRTQLDDPKVRAIADKGKYDTAVEVRGRPRTVTMPTPSRWYDGENIVHRI